MLGYDTQMSYIGFPLSLEETIRLMKEHVDKIDEAIEDIHDLNFVLAKFTSLRLKWIDKNQCILGLEVANFASRFWLPLLSVDEAIVQLVQTKLKFKEEVARLNLDLSSLTFCHMEDADSEQEFPEPCLFVGCL
jgi:hypothetical protein